MESYTRSDLACESCSGKEELSRRDEYTETSENGFEVIRLVIREEATARELGKPRGTYVTVHSGKIWQMEDDRMEELSALLAREIRGLLESVTGKAVDRNFGVLVAGLGNSDITPDAVGPLSIKQIQVTRHIKDELPEYFDAFGRSQVSALSPGVLGQTGIETVELIRGAVENAAPDAVVAIDALVARSCERLSATVQISDSGINPGSGIGNNRKSICRDTVGVPVIAVGIPTVVDSSTLVYDALEKAGIDEISDELREVLENGRGFFVSPKESDIITKKVAEVLANALDIAFSCEA